MVHALFCEYYRSGYRAHILQTKTWNNCHQGTKRQKTSDEYLSSRFDVLLVNFMQADVAKFNNTENRNDAKQKKVNQYGY